MRRKSPMIISELSDDDDDDDSPTYTPDTDLISPTQKLPKLILNKSNITPSANTTTSNRLWLY